MSNSYYMLLRQEFNEAKLNKIIYICFKVDDVGINLQFWFKTSVIVMIYVGRGGHTV